MWAFWSRADLVSSGSYLKVKWYKWDFQKVGGDLYLNVTPAERSTLWW